LASTHFFYPFATVTAGTWHDMVIELTQVIGRHITTEYGGIAAMLILLSLIFRPMSLCRWSQ